MSVTEFDEIIIGQRSDWLRPLILCMLVAVFANGLLKFLQLRCLRRRAHQRKDQDRKAKCDWLFTRQIQSQLPSIQAGYGYSL